MRSLYTCSLFISWETGDIVCVLFDLINDDEFESGDATFVFVFYT